MRTLALCIRLLLSACGWSATTHTVTRYVAGGTSANYGSLSVQVGDRVDVHIKPKVGWIITERREDHLRDTDTDTVGWVRTGGVTYSLTSHGIIRCHPPYETVTDRHHTVPSTV